MVRKKLIFMVCAVVLFAACGEGQIPLMMVSSYNHSEDIIQFLLGNGADVNAKGQYGQTALSIAELRENTAAFLLC